MLTESLCKKCSSFFYFEPRDGECRPLCPRCVDPNSLTGYTFLKETILNLIRKELEANGIDHSIFQRNDLIAMLDNYPRAKEVFFSNGSYKTVTIFPNDLFPGKHRDFVVGMLRQKKGHRPYRDVTCNTCHKTVKYTVNQVFRWYLNFEKKLCKNCDFTEYAVWKRDISGLQRGSKERESSDLFQAKAMNVSRNFYLKYRPTKRVEPLPNGTTLGTLSIVEAFWDTKKQCPRYRLLCDKCNQYFTINQNQITKATHLC